MKRHRAGQRGEHAGPLAKGAAAQGAPPAVDAFPLTSGAISPPHPTAAGFAGFLAHWPGSSWLLGLLLPLAVVLVYQPAWHGGFIWDDESHVVHNKLLFEADGLKRIWFSLEAPQYYPLVFTTFRLERALWGLDPTGYHFVNLLLHSGSALLLWGLLRQLRVRGAWLAAVVFALHPVNVESVAWITERKNTLSLFFFLLSLSWYLRFDRQNSTVGDQRSGMAKPRPPTFNLGLYYGLSLFAFALALLSKTAVAPLPVVFLLVVWWERGRIAWRDVWHSVPFFTAALALIPLTIVFEHQAGSEIIRSDNFCARLAGAGWAVWFYLYKAVLPINLSFVYPRWQIDATRAWSYVPGLLLVAGFLVSWRFRSQWGKPLLFGLGYFVVMLLPALGFVNIYFMRYSLVSDHWQYSAIIGPIALATAGASSAADWLFRKRNPWLQAMLCAILLLVLGTLTWRESAAYANVETVWRTSLRRHPNAWLPHYNLGTLLGLAGKLDEAVEHLREAVRIEPSCADSHDNLGVTLDRKGQIDEAIRQYQEALRLKPDNAECHNNLGAAYGKKGLIAEGIRQYQEAIRLEPDAAEAHYNLGTALSVTGQTEEAIRQYREALRLKPDFAQARDDLARALRAQPTPAAQ